MPRAKKVEAPVATSSQAERKKQPATSDQEGGAAVEDRPSNVKQDTAAKVEVNPKRRRTGEKAAAKKKPKVSQDAEDEDHQSMARLREAVMNAADLAQQLSETPVATSSQAKRKKQPATADQEGGAAVEDGPSNVKQDTAAKVEVNPKKRRTGEKAAAKKKPKVSQDAEDEDHQSVAGLREAQQRSEMLVIPLPSGAAELLRARWLGHLKALAEVDAQVFSMEEVTASCQVDLPEAPRFLDVYSPNGQAACTGRYQLLPETINEQCIWKKENLPSNCHKSLKFFSCGCTGRSRSLDL
eukprot:symbB.v1.2.039883.t1/scaffold6849.1/size15050/2